jgi:antirestriction protein ArdC
MKGNQMKDQVGKALDELVQAVERGESEQLKAYLGMLARFHRYSVGNVLLIGMQRPGATRVAGVRAWNKLGRHVKQGEKGIRIYAPIVWRKKDSEQGSEEGDDAEELVRFRSVCVFDVAQTDGRPLPEFAQARGEPGEYTGRLLDFAAERGIEVEFSDALVSAHGLSSGGNILVRKGMSPAEEFSVLAHELAHELLHRDEDELLSRTVRETEAEAVAFVVCQAVGLEATNAAADYIQLDLGSKETLLESLQRIREAAVEIIGAITGKDETRRKAGDTEWQGTGTGETQVAHAA